MSIQAVIWDFGGVILRTEDYSSRDRLAQKLGRTRQELEDLVFNHTSGELVQSGSIGEPEHWETVRRELNLNQQELLDFQIEFSSGDRLDSQLITFIRSLRPAYKTGLLSNNFPSFRQKLKEEWLIADVFDVIVISAEVGLLKPDERIYRLLLNQLQLAPHQCVFIDDFEHNLSGAKALGFHSIHFKSPAQAIGELEDLLHNQSRSGV